MSLIHARSRDKLPAMYVAYLQFRDGTDSDQRETKLDNIEQCS